MIKKLATIGNSYGVIIDRPLLREAGLTPDSRVELLVIDGSLVIRAAPAEARRPRRALKRNGATRQNADAAGSAD